MKMFIVSFVVYSMIFGVFGLLFGWSKSRKFFSLETLLGLIPSTVLALIVAVVCLCNLQMTIQNGMTENVQNVLLNGNYLILKSTDIQQLISTSAQNVKQSLIQQWI